jgi:hypothetical protein
MVRQMALSRQEEAQPLVLADIDYDTTKRWLIIRNVGKTPAYNLTVKFEPELYLFLDERLKEPFLSKEIAFLAPGTVLRTVIDFGPTRSPRASTEGDKIDVVEPAPDKEELLANRVHKSPLVRGDNEAQQYTVTLSYRPAWQKKHNIVSYSINLDYVKHLLSKKTADATDLSLGLERTERHLEDIATYFHNEDLDRHGIRGPHGGIARNLHGINNSLRDLVQRSPVATQESENQLKPTFQIRTPKSNVLKRILRLFIH